MLSLPHPSRAAGCPSPCFLVLFERPSCECLALRVRVCVWRVQCVCGRHYPAIQDFIRNSAPGVTGLQVTYTQGAPPNLFMQDAAGMTLEEVSIANWKSEHIAEYLSEKLASA